MEEKSFLFGIFDKIKFWICLVICNLFQDNIVKFFSIYDTNDLSIKWISGYSTSGHGEWIIKSVPLLQLMRKCNKYVFVHRADHCGNMIFSSAGGLCRWANCILFDRTCSREVHFTEKSKLWIFSNMQLSCFQGHCF